MILKSPPKMQSDINKVHFITLFEVLVVLTLLVSVGGGVWYRADQFLVQHQFRRDTARFLRLLEDARLLALYTKVDWQVRIEKNKKGWGVSLRSREELVASKLMQKTVQLASFGIQWNDKTITELVIEAASTGHIYPQGTVKILSPTGQELASFELPTQFYQAGVLNVGPAHPKNLSQYSSSYF
jgi:hypothetical protein